MLVENASAQTTKERRKKVTKDLNKDLMSLAEDPGASFEKKVKDHLDSLKCLQQSMAQEAVIQVISFFEGATTSIHLGVAAAATEEEADKVPSLPPIKKTQRQFQRKGQQVQQK